MSRIFGDVDLEQTLGTQNLPAMPQVAVALLNLSRDPNAGPAEYADIIELDPGLTAQVLRYVNSSYFGFRSEILSTRQAITLVGIRAIKNFVLYSAVYNVMPNPKQGGFDLRLLWQDSLRRALFARSISKAMGMKDAESPFAGALLQDMAVPFLVSKLPKAYEVLLETRRKEMDRQIRLSVLEEHAFGWNHGVAAGVVAKQWELPNDFVSLVTAHTEIGKWAAQADSEPECFSVALSALLPACDSNKWPEYKMFEKYYEKHRPRSAPDIPELLKSVDHQFSEFAPILRMSMPKQSLEDRYQLEADLAGPSEEEQAAMAVDAVLSSGSHSH
ncbi:MAG: HDOD domain-containing protein [Planctomycetia bacterium]|jgi:HD-like signal output (HDOD) protein